jgi:hypothetical protein
MATFTKFNSFVEAVAEKKHNLGSDQFVVALSTVAPTASNIVLADITQVAYTNLSTRNITTASSSQTGGLYSLVLTDLVLTASGGDSSAFRYVTIYNDTATNDELIGFYDYGASATITDGNTLTIDFSEANTLLTLQ